jgi:hypothetical protein
MLALYTSIIGLISSFLFLSPFDYSQENLMSLLGLISFPSPYLLCLKARVDRSLASRLGSSIINKMLSKFIVLTSAFSCCERSGANLANWPGLTTAHLRLQLL